MLRDVAAAPNADGWGIGGMLFFLAFFVIVLVRVITGKREDYERFGRIPLGDEFRPSQTATACVERPNKEEA
jgi:hypothetical protein